MKKEKIKIKIRKARIEDIPQIIEVEKSGLGRRKGSY